MTTARNDDEDASKQATTPMPSPAAPQIVFKVDDDDNDDDPESNTIPRDDSAIQIVQSQQSRESKYPAAFYCPITKELLRDPVVAVDGITYERSARKEQQQIAGNLNERLYRNIALETIMEERVDLSGTASRASLLLRWQKSMRQSMQHVMEKSILPTGEHRPLPSGFYCPITLDLIRVPVIDPEGNTFEKVAVVNWIRVNGNSPLSRTKLSVEDLYPNYAIRDLLNEEASRNEESIHPSVRKWKEEAPEDPEDLETMETYFPTTPEQLEQRRREREEAVWTGVTLFFCLVCCIMACVYAPFWTLSMFILCICAFCCESERRQR